MSMNYHCKKCNTSAHGWDENGQPICLNCFENAEWNKIEDDNMLGANSLAERVAIESMIVAINEYGVEGTFKKIDDLYNQPLVRASVRRSFLKAIKVLKEPFELFKIED